MNNDDIYYVSIIIKFQNKFSVAHLPTPLMTYPLPLLLLLVLLLLPTSGCTL